MSHKRRTHTPLVATEAGAHMALLDNTMVWAASEDFGWVRGKIVKVGSGEVDVQVSDRPHATGQAGMVMTVAYDDLLPVSELDEDPESIGDVLDLQVLHDAAVFETLRLRYFADKIYTSAGPTSLISINPYKQIMPLYTQRAINMYKDNMEGAPPHVFAMAQAAYNNLMDNGVCQSILCSGESGAGKTEVAKLVVQFLAATTSKESSFKGGGNKLNPFFQTRQVQNQIIESNPLLEAFGNAKTVRNENSSRFGKFIQILFSPDHTICGGRVRHYLLEKARVVSQHKGERNYHVFYQICAGLTGELRDKLHLAGPENFHYLNQSGVYQLLDTDGKPLCDEVVEFDRVQQSMTQMQIEEVTQRQIWEVLAAILHLGNIQFESVENKTSADGSKVSNGDILSFTADLLSCDASVLENCLTHSMVKVTGETNPIQVPQKAESAAASRDALCKVIYEKLFAWLVGCVNTCLSSSDVFSHLSENEKRKVESHFIGVLDIFGFEVFEYNSFEQLCINYANETLQQQFINQMLHSMMAQYEKEGVKVDAIPFEDNSPCVDLLESKMGIFALIDDECNVPKGSEEGFLSKLMDLHKSHTHLKPGGSSSDPHLKEGLQTSNAHSKYGSARVQSSKEAFVISHFAGEVEYTVTLFLEKNRDTINESLKTVLKSSQHALIRTIMQESNADDTDKDSASAGRMIGGRRVGGGTTRTTGARSAASAKQRQQDKRSLGFQFKQQLQELVSLIESGKAHYVRCVKPNNDRKSHCFEAPNVIRQLRCSGVTETVRARRAGWPVSYTFADFVSRYGEVYVSSARCRNSSYDHTKILEFFLKDPEMWRIGTSKVFLRDHASSIIEEKYKVFKLHCRLLLKAHVKAYLTRSKYQKWGTSCVMIQKTFRMWSALNQFRLKVAAIRTLVEHAKTSCAYRYMHKMRKATTFSQAAISRYFDRKNFFSRREFSLLMQAKLRRAMYMNKYVQKLRIQFAKEEEEKKKKQEEEERLRLARDERERAERAVKEKEGVEKQADILCEEVKVCVESGDLDLATECLESASDLYEKIGLSAKKLEVEALRQIIKEAREKKTATEEGDEELERAEAALVDDDIKTAQTAIQKAKAFYERAGITDDDRNMRAHKVLIRIQYIEFRQTLKNQGDAAYQKAAQCLKEGKISDGFAAIERAQQSYSRAGSASAEMEALEKLKAEMMKAKEAMDNDVQQERNKAAERESIEESEMQEAEAQAAAMRQEIERLETEAAAKAKAKQEEEQEDMDNKIAVSVGGYGHDRDSLSSQARGTPTSQKKESKGEREGAVQPVTLDPDPPLEVLKEGWLLKQSKKLKKWQKRYFVLDNVALYYCRSPTSVPDGFFAIRRCQFHYSEKTCCFDVITPARIFRMQVMNPMTPEGLTQLREWAACYRQAMSQRDFPYYHVEQTVRLDLSRELLLGVMSTGLRLVKLGLYDPGFEEEIAFYTFDEIYSWGASDLATFEFRVITERMPYCFKTLHAQEIEAKLESKFLKWKEWKIWQISLKKRNVGTPGKGLAR